MPIPYNLKVSQEEHIYEKMIKESDMSHVHIAPHALKAAAIFSVLTRLEVPKKQGVDLIKKCACTTEKMWRDLIPLT